MTLNNSSATGIDEIPNKIIKICREWIIAPLTYCINVSLTQGIFPEILKQVKVVPLFKKGDNELVSNYRPISLLSGFHKIFEKVMVVRVSSFLEKN